jgi:5-methylthioadenosine/S-adenosylhomocysteine deaminase
MTAPARTVIRAGHVIAYDGRGHRHLRDGVVVIEGKQIVHVGRSYDGPADAVVDAPHDILTPGLISTHAHIAGSPLDRSFIEDRGNPQFFMSGLFEMLPVRGASQDVEGSKACVDFSLAEMMRAGCTTVMEMGGQGEYIVERVPVYGMRVCVAQGFRSGRWVTYDGKRVAWEWNEPEGMKGLERAVTFIEKHQGAHDGLVSGFLSPAQVDTCTEDLFREAKREADRLGVPIQTHCSQSTVEFWEMLHRHGVTPTKWLDQIGVLGPNMILGHEIIIGGSSWSNYPAGDIQLLADSGCVVAHAPWVFGRRGIAMESFARYLRAGVNMSLGTDTNPQNMIEAMRWASVLSKVVDRQTEVATASDVFNAATLGGARALLRDDLGRIAPGALADMVLWRGRSWNMTPVRDPIKNIVFNANTEDVDKVWVNGRLTVDNNKVLGADEAAIFAALQASGERMWPKMGEFDWGGRGADELSPQTYPEWSDA